MGRHQATRAVFVDETGRRAAVIGVAMRFAAVLLVGTIAVLMVSVVGKVPLPGISPPVALPSTEHALPRQPRRITPSSSSATTSSSPSSSAQASAHAGAQAGGPVVTAQPAVATPQGSATPSAVASAAHSPAHGSPTRTVSPTKPHGRPTALPTHR